MDITTIDKNFKLPELTQKDVVWLNATEACFSLHGVFYEENRKQYLRMPVEKAEKASVGFAWGATQSAGGRVRFQTNSPYIAIKAVVPSHGIMNHMPLVGTSGFSLYENGKFIQMFTPNAQEFVKTEENAFAFQGVCGFLDEKTRSFELYFPLYNATAELFIGVREGSEIIPMPYERKEHISFYGSSITQGGCASRPGNDYISYLSRWLGVDVRNLGVSGSAKGERGIAEYVASLHSDVFVVDYDHNAPDAEHLKNTHYPFYEIIRKENPDKPILFISKPDFKGGEDILRREIIRSTYERAKAEGDENVYFIDGETLFGENDRDACTVDGCHPNDLGFYRMAETIYPVLKKILG